MWRSLLRYLVTWTHSDYRSETNAFVPKDMSDSERLGWPIGSQSGVLRSVAVMFLQASDSLSLWWKRPHSSWKTVSHDLKKKNADTYGRLQMKHTGHYDDLASMKTGLLWSPHTPHCDWPGVPTPPLHSSYRHPTRTFQTFGRGFKRTRLYLLSLTLQASFKPRAETVSPVSTLSHLNLKQTTVDGHHPHNPAPVPKHRPQPVTNHTGQLSWRSAPWASGDEATVRRS